MTERQFPHDPQGLDVSDLLRAAAQPGSAEELRGLAAFVQQFSAEVTAPAPISRSKPLYASRITRRATAMVAITLLAAGTAAAAAGGADLNPFKGSDNAAAIQAGHDADENTEDTEATDDTAVTEDTEATDDTDDTESSEAQGPEADGEAAHGLCEAWTHGAAKHTDNPAFAALDDAATENEQTIDEYCADVIATHEAEHGVHQDDDDEATEGSDDESDETESDDDDDDQESESHHGIEPSNTAPSTTDDHGKSGHGNSNGNHG